MSNPIYDLMYRGESGAAGYNAYNRGTYTDANGRERIRPGNPPMDFSRLTLGEVQDMQHLGRRDPDRVFAIGKYQIIPSTMDIAVAKLGLNRNQSFTPDLQDRVFCEYLLREKQSSVRDYIESKPGVTLEQAQHGLAREWASFGDPYKGGRSYYGGANQAHITLEQSGSALNQMRTQYAAAIERGLSPDEAWRAATIINPAQRTQAPPSADAPRTQSPRPERDTPVVLKQDTVGPEVRQLQEALSRLGYLGVDSKPLTVDSEFGRNTGHAVREFQRAHGLEVDGKVGPDTRAAMAQATQRPLVSEATHPSHKLYAAIGAQLPVDTRPEAIASITLQVLENGITGPGQLQGMAVRGSDVHLQGPHPGARVSVDISAPTPDLQAMSDHMARQMQEQQQERTRQQQQTRESPNMMV